MTVVICHLLYAQGCSVRFLVTLDVIFMDQQKYRRSSLHEIVRARLGLRKFAMAKALGHERQWYTWRCRPNCTMTALDLAELYQISGMTAEEFISAILEAGEGARLEQAESDLNKSPTGTA